MASSSASTASSSSTASSTASSSKVRVVVRMRPFLPSEAKDSAEQQQNPAKRLVTFEQKPNGGGTVSVRDSLEDGSALSTQYAFDGVYEAAATQQQLFDREVAPLLAHLFRGQSATVFCFGMTGTGKTHTMMGTKEDPGMVIRAVERLFTVLKQRASNNTNTNSIISDVRVSMSFLEIYCERVFDLLSAGEASGATASASTTATAPASSATASAPVTAVDPNKLSLSGDLPLRENAQNKVVVAGLSEHVVTSADAFSALYAAGTRNRKTAATKLNGRSSRSHSVLTIKIKFKEQSLADPSKITAVSSRLSLIDLAGNEDNRDSGNREAVAHAKRMAESANINKSIFVLGKVINALNSGTADATRIPYRDSKLTRLLQDSLGGGSHALMICNIAPAARFRLFTLRTLAYAAKGRSITNNLTTDCQQQQIETKQAAADKEQDRRAALEAFQQQRRERLAALGKPTKPSTLTAAAAGRTTKPIPITSNPPAAPVQPGQQQQQQQQQQPVLVDLKALSEQVAAKISGQINHDLLRIIAHRSTAILLLLVLLLPIAIIVILVSSSSITLLLHILIILLILHHVLLLCCCFACWSAPAARCCCCCGC